IDNEKMSKSINNCVLSKDLIETHNPMVRRFSMWSVPYRYPINFTATLLATAKHSFERIKTSSRTLEHSTPTCLDTDVANSSWMEKINQHETNFGAAMDDDFNTANAITVLFDLSKDANLYLNEKQTNSEVIELFQEKLVNLSEILGISLD